MARGCFVGTDLHRATGGGFLGSQVGEGRAQSGHPPVVGLRDVPWALARPDTRGRPQLASRHQAPGLCPEGTSVLHARGLRALRGPRGPQGSPSLCSLAAAGRPREGQPTGPPRSGDGCTHVPSQRPVTTGHPALWQGPEPPDADPPLGAAQLTAAPAGRLPPPTPFFQARPGPAASFRARVSPCSDSERPHVGRRRTGSDRPQRCADAASSFTPTHPACLSLPSAW